MANDRLWDVWQRQSWPARKADFSDPDTMWVCPFSSFGDIPYSNVTLDYVLQCGPMAPSRTVRSVMDARQFCS